MTFHAVKSGQVIFHAQLWFGYLRYFVLSWPDSPKKDYLISLLDNLNPTANILETKLGMRLVGWGTGVTILSCYPIFSTESPMPKIHASDTLQRTISRVFCWEYNMERIWGSNCFLNSSQPILFFFFLASLLFPTPQARTVPPKATQWAEERAGNTLETLTPWYYKCAYIRGF